MAATVARSRGPRKGRDRLAGLAALGVAALVGACASGPRQEAARPSVSATDASAAAASASALAARRASELTPPHMRDRPIVRAAILLPFSATSPAVREEAAALLAAAELALFENADDNFILIPKDSGSTPAAADAAVRAAIEDGADVILGPLFSTSVTAAAPVARASRAPIIAYSSDREVAGQGVYLLSFLPDLETERVVRYAARNGIKQIALLTPRTDYGKIVADAAKREARAQRIEVVADVTYERSATGLDAPAREAGAALARAPAGTGAVLIPERGNLLRVMAPVLAAAGAPSPRVRYLGTGLWNDPEAANEPALRGSWFAGPDPTTRDTFEARYRQSFSRTPTRLAGMGYDSTALVARIARGGKTNAFTRQALESADGFVGVDGLFRFRADGTSERGLAILKLTGSGDRVVEAAPRSFARPGS